MINKNLRNIFVIFFVFIALFFNYFLFVPIVKNDVIIELSKGTVLQTILDDLYDKKVINYKFPLKFWMYFTWNQNQLKIGEYKIHKNSSINDIKDIITSGRIYNKFITIPEGLTVKQIVELLNNNLEIAGEITTDIKEGSLFPQTYAYNKTITKNDIIIKMQNAMNEILNKEWEKRDKNVPFKTKEDALILASIVEKETSIAEERGLVASVFINRLNKNMRLQSDPTIVYVITDKYGNMKGKKLYSNQLKINSPFNTYKIKGLPPTPICNPGIESIKAVLHPIQTDFLYFVADGTGGHKFSATLDEHIKNVNDWRKLKKSL